MLDKIVDRLLAKCLSGKFILTVICGKVFAELAVAGLLPKEAVVTIITAVIISYFNRRNGGTNA